MPLPCAAPMCPLPTLRLARLIGVARAISTRTASLGSGIQAAHSPGSAVHDEIGYQSDAGFAGFTRTRNNAGGLEGGVSNGQEIRVRGYLKPISTLRRPLQSVDFATREPVKAAYERSDVCVVPAAGQRARAPDADGLCVLICILRSEHGALAAFEIFTLHLQLLGTNPANWTWSPLG